MEKSKRLSGLLLMVISMVLIISITFSYEADAATKGTISGLSNVTDGIKVTWTKNSSCTGYKIYKKTGTSKTWKLAKTVKKKSTLSWTDKNVKNGTKYRYKVRSYKGKKTASTTKYKTLYRMSKATITNAVEKEPGVIEVTGKKNSSASGFQITYATSSTFKSATSRSYKVTDPKLTIKGLSKGKTYYIKIRAYRFLGEAKHYGPYSGVVKVKIEAPATANKPDQADGTEGYQPAPPQVGTGVKTAGFGDKVVEKALYIYNRGNTTYIKGGEGEPRDGKYAFDCSGFASYVLKEVMGEYCPLYWVSANLTKLHDTDVIYNGGYKSELKTTTVCSGTWDPSKVSPGDLIFFNDLGTTRLYHVGIYIGDNKFIHSTEMIDGVGIDTMTGNHLKRFRNAKRFVPEKVESMGLKMKTDIDKYSYVSVYSAPDSKNVIDKLRLGDEVTLEYLKGDNSYGYITYGDGKSGYVWQPLNKFTER